MPITRYRLDAASPPELTAAQRALLDAMTEAEIEAAASADRDNPPLTAEELNRLDSARLVKTVRARTGLSQVAFAERYRISLGRLRDLEQGRTTADSAVAAYLTVIARDPAAVERALSAA